MSPLALPADPPFGAVQALEAAGLAVARMDGVWHVSDVAAAESILATHDPLSAARAQKLAELAAFRWDRQQAGFTLAGTRFATDAEARANLAGAALAALLAAQAEEEYQVTWKSPDGPVVLTGPVVIAAARAIEAWVRALFTREAALAEQIAALTDWQAVLAVEITEGWP